MIPTEPCSQTRVETNLLIMVLNVPVGGEMSYFRPWCERKRKKEKRRKQYPRTTGDLGAQHRWITPHQATKTGAMCVCMSLWLYVCLCAVCEWRSTQREKEKREWQRAGWGGAWSRCEKCLLSGGLGRRGCNRLNQCLGAHPMANPVLLRVAVRVFHSHSTPLQCGQGCWHGFHMALHCCEYWGDGEASRQPRTQSDVTDGSTIKWASSLHSARTPGSSEVHQITLGGM